MTVWQALIVAISGAGVGALFTYWLGRARPRVSVHSIRIAAEYPDSAASARVDSTILERADRLTVRTSIQDVGVAATEAEYVQALKETLGQAQRRTPELNYLNRQLGAFRSQIVSENFESALKAFTSIDVQLFDLLMSFRLVRQATIPLIEQLGSDPVDPNEQVKVHRQPDPQSGRDFVLVILPVTGPQNVVLSVSSWPTVQQQTVERAAVGLSRALSKPDRAALLEVCDKAEGMIRDQIEATEELERAALASLVPFDRLIVEGIIANSGVRPVSALPRCRFFISLNGYPSSDGVVGEDVAVWLRFYDRQNHEPIVGASVLRPGESLSFIAVSEGDVIALPHAGALAQAFGGGTVGSYIGIGLVGRGRKDASVSYSPVRLFRDIEGRQEIPPKPR